VDATGKAVYKGDMQELIACRGSDSGLFDDMAVMKLMQRLLAHISPLNLINPHADEFTAENCETIHDITRFAHQKSMTEMFSGAKGVGADEKGGVRLKTDIPLAVRMVSIENSEDSDNGKKWISEDEIPSVPMQAFWSGLRKQGWPSSAPPPNLKGFTSVMTTHLSATDHERFEESSYVVLSREYMVFSLRLGYHFTTIEAMCTDELNQNYIRFQHKGGGASLDRRVHRVNLIKTILTRMGFTNFNQGDFLDSKIAYQDSESLQAKLHLLGRLTMKTKQLDMALSNESVTKWYAEDIIQSLGL
jgi:pyruvate,water dikinase